MKILFFIFVIFLLKIVEGNERNRRALPPFYLSVEGFEKCLESKETNEDYEVWCFPEKKPANCDPKSWKQLKENQDNDGLKQCCNI
uniref:Candidate secreted effector n=1 Tax=Meloidogyne incognita TaxID=6306 RepID=A0A914NWX6_MELIC